MASVQPKPGIVDKITSSISRLFNKNQVIINLPSPVISRGLPVYPNPSATRFIDEGYCGNASIYTIISTAARKFGYLPRYVYRIENKTAEKQLKALIRQKEYKIRDIKRLHKKAYNEQIIDDNAFSELMSRPNPKEGQDSFYMRACIFAMATGEVFIQLNRGDTTDFDGRPQDDDTVNKMPILEMYVLPSQYVELIADPDDVWGVLGYIFNKNGVREFIRKDDMIHWRQPNPKFDAYTRVHLRGLAPLEPGNKLTEQDESATDASVAMQQNDGAKALIFQDPPMDMDAVQKSTLESVIDRKINNRDRKGAVAVMQSKWGKVDLSMSSVDMQLIESQEKVFIRFCNLFGIDPMMFLADATYANKKEAKKDLITGLLLPLSASLKDEMNRVLLPAFGLDKTYTHDVDVTNLPELQEDMTEKVKQLTAAWWLTPNQRLEEMNEERSDDALMDKIWIPNNLILMDDAAQTDLLNSFTNGPDNQDSGGNLSNTLPDGSGAGDS